MGTKTMENQAPIIRNGFPNFIFPPCFGNFFNDDICKSCPRANSSIIEQDIEFYLEKFLPNPKYLKKMKRLSIWKDFATEGVLSPEKARELAYLIYSCIKRAYYKRTMLKLKPLLWDEQFSAQRTRYFNKLKRRA